MTAPRTAPHPLRWGPIRRSEAEELREQGYSYKAIGRRFGVNGRAVRYMFDRTGRVEPHVLTGLAFRKLMGFSSGQALLLNLVRDGTIPSTCVSYGRSPRTWLVDYEALIAWLEDERYWGLWDPERITDPALCEWACEMRRDAFRLTPREIARLCGVRPGRVLRWIRRGQLPATSLPTAIRHSHFYVLERDLRAFLAHAGLAPKRAA